MAQIFPKWSNYTVLAITVKAVGGLLAAIFVFAWWFSPKYTDVGFSPDQPVAFSHKLHAGELGMDCRYCHNTVERAARAAIPPTSTCMNCHKVVKTDSPEIMKVAKAHNEGKPIEWVRVHMLPDYAFFDHSVHVAAGVGCATCHGRVDQMKKVTQHAPLSMAWCLDCHRNPEPNLRPKSEVVNMAWATDPAFAGYNPAEDPHRTREVQPPEHCSGCHR